MSAKHRVWAGGAENAGAVARLHAGAMADAWPEPSFASLLSNPDVFVLLGATWGADEPQGFILVRIAADEAEVLTFCVAQSVRRAGLGVALLEAACEMAQRRFAEQVFLEVSHDNAAALALYQKCGFTVVGRRAAYYRHGTGAADALVMRRPIAAGDKGAASFQAAPESTKSE